MSADAFTAVLTIKRSGAGGGNQRDAGTVAYKLTSYKVSDLLRRRGGCQRLLVMSHSGWHIR